MTQPFGQIFSPAMLSGTPYFSRLNVLLILHGIIPIRFGFKARFQKNPALTSKPKDAMQSEASKPTQHNSATILNGRASVCASAALPLRTFATIVFMAIPSSGLDAI
jgi:hypothetical protein